MIDTKLDRFQSQILSEKSFHFNIDYKFTMNESYNNLLKLFILTINKPKLKQWVVTLVN